MAAGLGYIEFTTGDVLTAASANGYLASQVVMVFASAAARTSAIASPQEGMISYLKDTNATEYYSGSAWVAIGGGGLSSPLTTKGDVWGYSTTNARIPVGTNGQVLTADSAETLGLKWATPSSGGMTQIATGTLSGSTLTLSSIAGTYKDLRLVLDNVQVNAIVGLRFKVNNNGSAIYDGFSSEGRSAAIREAYYTGETLIEWTYYRPVTGDNGNVYILDFPNYASSTAFKTVRLIGEGNCADGSGTGAGLPVINNSDFAVRTLTAISEINLSLSSSTFAGGTYTLFGVN